MTHEQVLKQNGYFRDIQGNWVKADYTIKDPAVRQKKEKVLTDTTVYTMHVGALAQMLKQL